MKNSRIETAYLSLIAEANLGDGSAKAETLENMFYAGRFDEIINDEVVQDLFREIGLTVAASNGAMQMKKFENYEALPMAMEEAEMKAYDDSAAEVAKLNSNIEGLVSLVSDLRAEVADLKKKGVEREKMFAEALKEAKKSTDATTDKIAKAVCKRLKWQQFKHTAIQMICIVGACAAMLTAGGLYVTNAASMDPKAAYEKYELAAKRYEMQPTKMNALRKANALARRTINQTANPRDALKDGAERLGDKAIVKIDQAATKVETMRKGPCEWCS